MEKTTPMPTIAKIELDTPAFRDHLISEENRVGKTFREMSNVERQEAVRRYLQEEMGFSAEEIILQ